MQQPELTQDELLARRRRVRATTWWLVLVACVVYITFIIAFINRK